VINLIAPIGDAKTLIAGAKTDIIILIIIIREEIMTAVEFRDTIHLEIP
jgi:hypothetical protein